MPKLANYAAIVARDQQALAIARETGCGFVEAWQRLLDAEETGNLRTQNETLEVRA